jgi:hypothetical protein
MYGRPGLPGGAEGPIEAVSAEAMAGRLVDAGFGKGRWTNYRVRLAMCYSGGGEAESYSAQLSRTLAAHGVSNETIGYRGAVTTMGGRPTGTLRPPSPGQPKSPAAAEPGEPVAANFYPVYEGTTFGAPGTRLRRDVNRPQAAPGKLGATPVSGQVVPKVPSAPAVRGGPTIPKAPTTPAADFEAAAGAAAGEAIAHAVMGIAAIVIQQKYVDPQNEEAFQKELENQKPAIESRLTSKFADINALVQNGKPAFVNIVLRVQYQADHETGLNFFAGLILADVQVSDHDIQKTEYTKKESFFALYFDNLVGHTDLLVTYSVQLAVASPSLPLAAPLKPAAGRHTTPPGVHLDTRPDRFPTVEEQKSAPCPNCHTVNRGEDKLGSIPEEWKKPMMTEEELRQWTERRGR